MHVKEQTSYTVTLSFESLLFPSSLLTFGIVRPPSHLPVIVVGHGIYLSCFVLLWLPARLNIAAVFFYVRFCIFGMCYFSCQFPLLAWLVLLLLSLYRFWISFILSYMHMNCKQYLPAWGCFLHFLYWIYFVIELKVFKHDHIYQCIVTWVLFNKYLFTPGHNDILVFLLVEDKI